MTRRLLNRLGLNASVFGYVYLEYAVELVKQNRDLLKHVTTLLYPIIAEHFRVSPASVERTIRYAIGNCWEKGNRKLLNDIAGRELAERPYTREFIAMLADYVEDGDLLMRMRLSMLTQTGLPGLGTLLPADVANEPS